MVSEGESKIATTRFSLWALQWILVKIAGQTSTESGALC